jgi:glutathione S-transferase
MRGAPVTDPRGANPMLRIWGRLSSINVQKVVWCADELGLPYERTEAGGTFGVVDTPQYLAMNPNGLVPLIEDEGFVLWESNAIVKYLCAKHSPGNLSPTDPHEYADADRWISWQGTTLWPPMREVLLKLVRMPEDKRDPKRIAELVATVTEHWEVLNGRLEGRK